MRGNNFSLLFKSKVSGQIAIYTIFSAVQKAIPFLLLPIWTRCFSKSDLGEYIIFQSLSIIIFPLVTLSADSALSINYFKLGKYAFSRYLTNVLAFIFTAYVFFIIALIGLSCFLTDIAGVSLELVIFALLMVFPQAIYLIRLVLYRNQNRSFRYGLYALLSTFFSGGISLLFVFVLHTSWYGLVYGQLLGTLIVGGIGICSLYKEKFFDFRRSNVFLLDAVKIGAPISLQAVGSWFIASFDKLLIGNRIGLAATGVYGVAGTFGTIMNFFPESLYTAYIPYLFDKLKNANEQTSRLLVKSSLLLYGLIIAFAIFVFCLGYWGIDFFYGPKYHSAKELVFPFVLSAMFLGLSKVHNGYIFFVKKTHYMALITLTAGGLNLFLLYLLVPKYGMIGAAYSSVVTNFYIYAFTLIVSNQVFPLSWRKTIIY